VSVVYGGGPHWQNSLRASTQRTLSECPTFFASKLLEAIILAPWSGRSSETDDRTRNPRGCHNTHLQFHRTNLPSQNGDNNNTTPQPNTRHPFPHGGPWHAHGGSAFFPPPQQRRSCPRRTARRRLPRTWPFLVLLTVAAVLYFLKENQALREMDELIGCSSGRSAFNMSVYH
jgi:hypothetical protein